MAMYDLVSNPFLPEFRVVTVERERTFYERWVYPIFVDPFTTPFEPWISTEKITRIERTFLYAGNKIFTHPNNIDFVRKTLGTNAVTPR